MPGNFDDIISNIKGSAPSSTLESNQNAPVFGDILGGIAPQVHEAEGLVPPAFQPGPPAGGTAEDWSNWQDLANNALLGGGVYTQAAGRATGQVISDYAAGAPLGTVASGFVPQLKANAAANKQAREAWAKAHPGEALRNMIVGATPTTLGAMALGQEYAVAPLARGVAAVLPNAARAVEGALDAPGIAGALARTSGRAITGGAQGATAGALQNQLTGNTLGSDITVGGAVGSAINPVLGAAIPGIGRYLSAEVKPRAAYLAQVLQNHGVDVKAGQIVADQSGLAREAGQLGTMGDETTIQQYNKAFARLVNPYRPPPDFSQENVDIVKGQLGNRFQQFADNVGHIGDGTLDNELSKIRFNAANDLGQDTPEYKKVSMFIKQIQDRNGALTLDGTQFRRFTASTGPLVEQLVKSNNGTVSRFGQNITDSLYSALQRADPANAAEIDAIRGRYRILSQLAPAIKRAQSTGGLLDPSVVATTLGGAKGEVGDLAKAGSLLKDVKPTAQGSAAPRNKLEVAFDYGKRLLSGGASGVLGGAAAYAPQALGLAESNVPIIGVAGGLATAGKMARDAYAKHLLGSEYLTNRLIGQTARRYPNAGITPGIPTKPASLVGAQAAGNMPIVLGTELYNRGQQ